MFGNFAKIGRAAGASFNQNLVLLFVFSFSSFVNKTKFGAFVRIFI
jgi:hypothetical protein